MSLWQNVLHIIIKTYLGVRTIVLSICHTFPLGLVWVEINCDNYTKYGI